MKNEVEHANPRRVEWNDQFDKDDLKLIWSHLSELHSLGLVLPDGKDPEILRRTTGMQLVEYALALFNDEIFWTSVPDEVRFDDEETRKRVDSINSVVNGLHAIRKTSKTKIQGRLDRTFPSAPGTLQDIGGKLRADLTKLRKKEELRRKLWELIQPCTKA